MTYIRTTREVFDQLDIKSTKLTLDVVNPTRVAIGQCDRKRVGAVARVRGRLHPHDQYLPGIAQHDRSRTRVTRDLRLPIEPGAVDRDRHRAPRDDRALHERGGRLCGRWWRHFHDRPRRGEGGLV